MQTCTSGSRSFRAGRRRSPLNVQTNVSELERGLSAFAGAIMLGAGLCRTRLSGLGMALLGASLTYRAMSGHCHVYEALGLNFARGETGEHDGEGEPGIQEGRSPSMAPD